jgi:cyclopropane fatty-acyl-phospholipid synthase-like methyltransferase
MGDVHDDGCGTGENVLFFAGRGHIVLGIDLLEGPIRESRRKAEERGLDAEFARMEYVGDGQFNLAYMRHTSKWWEVYRGLTADECLKRIGDEAIFQP